MVKTTKVNDRRKAKGGGEVGTGAGNVDQRAAYAAIGKNISILL